MLTIAFFTIALLYSIIGFGGGSSYLALMSEAGISFLDIPKIGLICNVLVTTSGCYHFWKNGYFNSKLITPFVLASIPMSFLGGLFPITEFYFMTVLSSVLIISGVRLLIVHPRYKGEDSYPSKKVSIFIGGILGLLSGAVGLGGGIFLSPLMMNKGWGRPKEIAACASGFIWLNSVSGLLGQIVKSATMNLASYWPLFFSVILGGQIGSRIAINTKISHLWIQKGTGILIVYVALKLITKLFSF